MSDLAEIREQLADVQRSLGRVEGKLDGLTTLEPRVRALEDHRQQAAGRSGLKSFVAHTLSISIGAAVAWALGMLGLSRGH